MINWIRQIIREYRLKPYYEELVRSFIDTQKDLKDSVFNYRKENKSLSGRIKILEEQQEIMHNFLVEINKYLVNLVDKDKK